MPAPSTEARKTPDERITRGLGGGECARKLAMSNLPWPIIFPRKAIAATPASVEAYSQKDTWTESQAQREKERDLCRGATHNQSETPVYSDTPDWRMLLNVQ